MSQPSPLIAGSIAAFLNAYPPFSFLKLEELHRLANQTVVKHMEEGEWVLKTGQTPADHFYVVNKGSVHILSEAEGQEVLVDVCDEGDVFGLRALLAEGAYVSSAKVSEEALLYLLPIAPFEHILEHNPRVSLFFAAGFASRLPSRIETLLEKAPAHFPSNNELSENPVASERDLRIVDGVKEVMTCSPDISVWEAAKKMSDKRIGSLIVASQDRIPIGILTDSDLRRRVIAKGLNPAETKISEIMTSPVMTIKRGMNVSELIITMIRQRIRHFVVTEDGTPKTPVIGIISERDVLSTQGSNPGVIFREITRAETAERMNNLRGKAEVLMQQYLEQEVGMNFISGVMKEINDAILTRVMQMVTEKMQEKGYGEPPMRFCWLSLGSEGRKEQLLRTDQDNALVYEDPPEKEAASVQSYFLTFASIANELLEACGFERCPADMMASNPQWCLSLSGWKKQFYQWVATPKPKAVMHSTIFFDFRPVYGDKTLSETLRNYIFELVDKDKLFTSLLAKGALNNPPPLSFFRKFIVEKGGQHEDRFDIKARAMMPLADAARVLAYSAHILEEVGTVERFRAVAQKEQKDKDLFEEAAMAYEILMRFRALNGLRHKDSGRYIEVEHLNKLHRQTLRNVFVTITKIQKLLRVRFQTDMIR